MPVLTGGTQPARGAARLWYWFSLAIGVAGVILALVTGHGGFAGSGFLLTYPLWRLFSNRPGSDPSKSGWERARASRGSGPPQSMS
jgi:hypothetical protein